MPNCPAHPGKPLRDGGQYGFGCTFKVGVPNLPQGTTGAPYGTNKNGYCKYSLPAENGAPAPPVPVLPLSAPSVTPDTDLRLTAAVAALNFAGAIYRGNPAAVVEALNIEAQVFERLIARAKGLPVVGFAVEDADIPF